MLRLCQGFMPIGLVSRFAVLTVASGCVTDIAPTDITDFIDNLCGSVRLVVDIYTILSPIHNSPAFKG